MVTTRRGVAGVKPEKGVSKTSRGISKTSKSAPKSATLASTSTSRAEKKNSSRVARRKTAKKVPNAGVDVPEEDVETLGVDEERATSPPARPTRPKRRATRGVARAIAALKEEGDENDAEEVVVVKPEKRTRKKSRTELKEEAGDDDPLEDSTDSVDAVEDDVDAEELYEPEETVRGKRAKRKAAQDAEREANKHEKEAKKRTFRVPELVERVWYEAGSVIIRQLQRLLNDDIKAIKQSKALLEMDLLAPDAFSEVWGGRADILKMRKPELVKLGQAAGIKGLTSKRLDEVRDACKALSLLSTRNYKLWRGAEEAEIRRSIRKNVLLDEPLWLEELINENDDVYEAYRTTLKSQLRMPDDIVHSMQCRTSYLTFRRYYGSWDQTVFLYRASVAIAGAVRWREFVGLPPLDIKKIVSEHSDLRDSLNSETKLRGEILGRVDMLRKDWKALGRRSGPSLDDVIQSGGLQNRNFAVTADFIACGGADRRKTAIKAAKVMLKYGLESESDALKIEDRVARFKLLASAVEEKGLELPVGMDPTVSTTRAKQEAVSIRHDVSHAYVYDNKGSLGESVKAYELLCTFQDDVLTESAVLILKGKSDRLEEVIAAWRAHSLDDVDRLGIDMPKELREKYPVTHMYIQGDHRGRSKDITSTVAARLDMRDRGGDCEISAAISLQEMWSFKRQPGNPHVFICPCGYYSGRAKMERHLRMNADVYEIRSHRR